VAALHSTAAKAGPTVRRAIPQVRSDEAMTVENYGSAKKGNTLKVVAARTNLTGQRELAWAADAGEQVGEARCTQNFRLSNETDSRERPTMLLCWRLSDVRSVYTLAVDIHGRPVKQTSVDALDKAWAKLG
jgi:hypothetical protein